VDDAALSEVKKASGAAFQDAGDVGQSLDVARPENVNSLGTAHGMSAANVEKRQTGEDADDEVDADDEEMMLMSATALGMWMS